MNETIEKIAKVVNEVAFVQAHEENGDEHLCEVVAKAIYTKIVEPLEREIEELEKEIDLEVDLQAKRKRQIIYESQEFIDELAHKAKVLEQEKDLYKKSAIEMNDKFLQAMKRVEVLERALKLACEPRDDWGACTINYYQDFIKQAEKELPNETI